MLVQVYNLSTSGVRQDLQVSLSYTVSSTRARATYHLNQQKRRVAERDGDKEKITGVKILKCILYISQYVSETLGTINICSN